MLLVDLSDKDGIVVLEFRAGLLPDPVCDVSSCVSVIAQSPISCAIAIVSFGKPCIDAASRSDNLAIDFGQLSQLLGPIFSQAFFQDCIVRGAPTCSSRGSCPIAIEQCKEDAEGLRSEAAQDDAGER
ncbi:hypothetical protein PHSY_002157 [Pseudozyma hubeiensis SY62]|uniref:Uncharacterized protein n=1 Tax=Pseudozyma hubeiensis (strain SY62) TaxID=1305764 RepID=R9P0G0_PSEHS|nr:hypothetical protein PHSY_002157 [Pseudozyma hubeiensis SY62]GAC94584.1 hypothetical protein PHSY_002157 [Pseudozyma hubeiensis SY62]